MPMYEFECKDCKTLFETIVKSAEAAKEVSCKKCGSKNITKVVSAGSFKMAGATALPSGGCSSKGGFS